MEYAYHDVPGLPVHTRLLQGCSLEAQRADIVSGCIDTLRTCLPDSFHSHMAAVSEEVRGSARLLRDLADRSQVHLTRVPIVLNYLNVLLPCLCRSLRDMHGFYEDKALTKEIRWRTMYHKMTEEAAGLPLPQRFMLYNHFLTLLGQLLTRCDHARCTPTADGRRADPCSRNPNFDMNALESSQTRILQLREKRGIGETRPGTADGITS